jgi:hypothetical protein
MSTEHETLLRNLGWSEDLIKAFTSTPLPPVREEIVASVLTAPQADSTTFVLG